MVAGMKPPAVVKPQPKPQLKEVTRPTPEFMWCQRSDKVYVTIKVADCKNAKLDVVEDGTVLEFTGTGHGMCGEREYALSVELAKPVTPAECVWFVSGPNVRVRLEKATPGPYWDGLLAGKRKMVQLKVDWASWLDEDEENERSTAPTGFDVPAMKTMMVGSDKCELYRNVDRFDSSTTPDEGEETNSILIDEGMNSIDDIQIKFKALEYEKEETAKTKTARYELRRKTREAQLFVKQRENDLKYSRPTRDVTQEEWDLIAKADGLYERLKAEKLQEKLYWLGKWWHQRRPEKRKIDMAEPLARQAAIDTIAEELARVERDGLSMDDKKTRREVERNVFIKSRQAALDLFDQWEHHTSDAQRKVQDQEGRNFTARDMGAKITREELSKALNEPMPDLAKSLQLKQFADPRPKDELPQKPGGDDDEDEGEGETEYESDSDGWVTAATSKPPIARKKDAPAAAGNDGGDDDDDDGPALELEENDGTATAAVDDEEDDGPDLELEENDGQEVNLDDDDDDDGCLELEENGGVV